MSLSSTNFLFYADYFAHIADSGLNRARALFPGIEASLRTDLTTIVNKNNTNVQSILTRKLDTAYEYLWLDGQNLNQIRDAFNGLSKYVLESTGSDVETFLTQNGITVKSTYATLANIFGENISESNISA